MVGLPGQVINRQAYRGPLPKFGAKESPAKEFLGKIPPETVPPSKEPDASQMAAAHPAGFWGRLKGGLETVLRPVLWLNKNYRMGSYAKDSNPQKRLWALDMALGLDSEHLTQGKKQSDILKKLNADPEEAVRLAVVKACGSEPIAPSVKKDLITHQMTLPGNSAVKKWVLDQLMSPQSTLATTPNLREICFSLARQDQEPQVRKHVLKVAQTLPKDAPEVHKMMLLNEDAHPEVMGELLTFLLHRMVKVGDVTPQEGRQLLDKMAESTQMPHRWAVIHKLFVWPLMPSEQMALIQTMDSMATPEVRGVLVMAASLLPDEMAFRLLWRYSLDLNYNMRRKAAIHLANLSDEAKKYALLELAKRDPEASVREAARQTASIAFQSPRYKEKAKNLKFAPV